MSQSSSSFEFNNVLNVLQLLQLTAKRGGFELSEFTLIGKLYDKFKNIADTVQKQQKEQEEKKEKEKEKEKESQDNTTDSESKPPTITVHDILAIKSIIDICTERGVYKANEMSPISTLYETVVKCLDQFKLLNESSEEGTSGEPSISEQSNSSSTTTA